MITEIKLKNRTARLQLVERKDNLLKVRLDDKTYDLDIVEAGNGVYSVLHEGKSYNIQLVDDSTGKYFVNVYNRTYGLEVIDAQKRYRINRVGSGAIQGDKNIISPMPGKIVKVLVKEGDTVTAGQIVVIVSAMKMESEFKAVCEGVVKKVFIKEGDTVEGNKTLIIIE